MLIRAWQTLQRFWTLLLEMDVRYTSVPIWSPWQDFTFKNEEILESSR
jgi:hypothetical protein